MKQNSFPHNAETKQKMVKKIVHLIRHKGFYFCRVLPGRLSATRSRAVRMKNRNRNVGVGTGDC